MSANGLSLRTVLVLLVPALFVAACTTAPTEPGMPAEAPIPGESPAPSPAPEAPAAAAKPAPQENVAVAGLMKNARKDSEAGRLANAAATLERALRIEPRNARLWHELALVRLKQGEYAQAATLAARSNSWAGSDPDLRAANQRIIDDARIARGR